MTAQRYVIRLIVADTMLRPNAGFYMLPLLLRTCGSDFISLYSDLSIFTSWLLLFAPFVYIYISLVLGPTSN